MFDYCTSHLGYSESAANRRIRTARCIRSFPEVHEMLIVNEVTVTTVSVFSRILSQYNKDDVLRMVRGRTQREVEAIVSRYRPGRMVRDRVTPVSLVSAKGKGPGLFDDVDTDERSGRPGNGNHSAVPKKDFSQMSRIEKWFMRCDNGGRDLELEQFLDEWKNSYRRSGGGELTTSDGGTSIDGGNATDNVSAIDGIEQKFKLEFAVSKDFMKKLEQVKSLLSNRYPYGLEFEKIFEILIDEYLDRHSPEKKKERREMRRHRANKDGEIRAPDNHTRYIAAPVRDEVFTRDGGRCTYVGLGGRRCNSTWGLHIDHITPYARGGKNTADNLRLLCAKHNRLAAEACYGNGFMAQFYRRE